MRTQAYETSVREMAKRFNFDPVFAHENPNTASPDEWIASRIAECQFALFDLTGLDSDVVFALGIATQSDDATLRTFIDLEEHRRTKVNVGGAAAALIAQAKPFIGADDFQRKAQMFVGERVGPSQLRDGAFIARIKDGIAKKGPIYMRQLANDLGRPMPELQPIVYELVRKGEVKKISDRRWTQYSS
jgi:hypothetical protein